MAGCATHLEWALTYWRHSS